MKPTLYWAVKRETYGRRYTVMRVTSENDRAAFGSEAGMSTHCRRGEILGKHASEDAARARVAAVEEVEKKWEPTIAELRSKLVAAENLRDKAMRAAAQGVEFDFHNPF